MTRIPVVLLCGLCVNVVVPIVEAGKHEIPIVLRKAWVHETTTDGGGLFLDTNIQLQVSAAEAIIYAEIRFEEPYPEQTELELWPLSSDAGAVDSSYGRNVWTMDSRTGNVARFDITSLAKQWITDPASNWGVIVQVAGTESEWSNSSLNLEAGGPAPASIVIYTLRMPATLPSPKPPSSRTRPNPEDGSSKHD